MQLARQDALRTRDSGGVVYVIPAVVRTIAVVTTVAVATTDPD